MVSGVANDVLLVFAGALTALPLIGFAYAVRRIPLSVVGLMQYIAPTLQFLIGVLVLRETFDARARWPASSSSGCGLAVFAGEGLWRARRQTALAAG